LYMSLFIYLIKLKAQCIVDCGIRGASHNGREVERTLDKLSLRRQGRSSLKYKNYRLCISLERNVYPLMESLGFHKCCGQVFFPPDKLLMPKLPKSVVI
jgi:hypothetical protein